MTRMTIAFLLVASAVPAPAQPLDHDPTVRAMKDELARSMAHLGRPALGKPYYLSYSVWQLQTARIRANLGALISSVANAHRSADVDLRIGDHMLDNSNVLDPQAVRNPWLANRHRMGGSLPIVADYDADRHALWTATVRAYDHANALFEHKKTLAKGASTFGGTPSFSKETPTSIIDSQVRAVPERARLEDLARKLSAVFRTNPDVHEGSITIESTIGKQYFVSSEGVSSVRPVALLKIEVACDSRADDGMPVSDGVTWFSGSLDELPADADLVRQVENVSLRLSAIRGSPVVRNYMGPVLFENVAAGQLVQILLAENLVGTPPRAGESGLVRGQTSLKTLGDTELANVVGLKILPVGTSIVDDPTITRAGSSILVGGYRFDAEGVEARRTSLVENGILKRFLMSRTPRPGFARSTGHATSTAYRASPANLLVSSTKSMSNAELRKQALALAKERSMAYAIVVEVFAAADLQELRRDPSAYLYGESALRPIVTKRIYADGREEWVRGVTFAPPDLDKLVAMGSRPIVYSSGKDGSRYFMSIVAPPLLFDSIRISRSRPEEGVDVPPIVSRPAPP